jgi:hypothetical protein
MRLLGQGEERVDNFHHWLHEVDVDDVRSVIFSAVHNVYS